MDADIYRLKVLLLRAETLVGHSFENTLRSAGHPVTVISSREAAFALIDSMNPDMVVFDPISEFGFSGSVQRLCASFDGPIVATGLNANSQMAARLQHLGVAIFAENAAELLDTVRAVPVSEVTDRRARLPARRQHGAPRPASQMAPVNTRPAEARSTDARPGKQNSDPGASSKPGHLRRWYLVAAGGLIALVVAFMVHGIVGSMSTADDEPVAKALPVVPSILLKPLVPLTIEELTGDTLPLKISGIKDRAVIEAPAVAFWGDTAPDAFVTVNGDRVEVSEYGAFVIDYPLEDGANFIEVIASDFQGRTSRVSLTLVRTQ